MMKKLLCKLGRHKWIKYKAIPERDIYWLAGQVFNDEGTAVFSKCSECSKKRKTWYQDKYKIVDGFLIRMS